MHDFGLLSDDGKAKVVACRGEFVHAELHLGLRACIQHAIISKKEIPQYSQLHLGDCLELLYNCKLVLINLYRLGERSTIPTCPSFIAIVHKGNSPILKVLFLILDLY